MGAAFSATIFLSAWLLFLVQPMFSKMVLPLMGGGAFVWNTCILFFELTLLAGYLYSHLVSRYLGLRQQLWLHVSFIGLTILALPVRLRVGPPPPGAEPVGWLLLLLGASIGLPFFVLSTTGPLLQRWFAETDHRDAGSPYFLYSASNAGSLLALAMYPFVVEPRLRLAHQRAAWSAGYAVVIMLIGACAWIVGRSTGFRVDPGLRADGEPRQSMPAPMIIRWVLLAAVPSGMMLAITTYLTTDITPVPLLWVIPLGLYLLSFVLVFARRPRPPHRFWVRWQPLLLISVAVFLFWGPAAVAPLIIPFHLLAFFFTAMVCHGELVRTRPPVDGMTAFYVWMSVGGALGGAFCAIAAPLIFRSIAEYSWLLVAACLLRPHGPAERRIGLDELALVLAIGLLGLVAGLRAAGSTRLGTGLGVSPLPAALLCGVVALLLYRVRNQPVRLGTGVALMLWVGATLVAITGKTVYAERNFYGARRITDEGGLLALLHGSTTHGAQYKSPARRAEPLTYYHQTGPVGDVFRALPAARRRVAVVGLGAGTLAAYGRAGDRFDFYEIDPEIARIAASGRWFTYLQITPAEVHVLLGDGRLRLAEAPDGVYDLIVLDAFNSDAVPVHLLTRQAVAMYLRKLGPSGILALHLSNRFLDLQPVAAALAADLGVRGRVRSATAPPQRMLAGSVWAALSRDSMALEPLHSWSAMSGIARVPVWTDDYSNIFTLVRPLRSWR